MIPVEVFYKDKRHQVYYCERFSMDSDEDTYSLEDVLGYFHNIEDELIIKRQDVVRVVIPGL